MKNPKGSDSIPPERAYADRDAEWTRMLGVTDRVMTPEEAREWLEKDRIIRARHVAAARPQRGPIYW